MNNYEHVEKDAIKTLAAIQENQIKSDKKVDELMSMVTGSKTLSDIYGTKDTKNTQESKEIKAVMKDYMRSGFLSDESKKRWIDYSKTKLLSSDNNQQIGYLVEENISFAILNEVKETSMIRAEATVETIASGDSMTFFVNISTKEFETFQRDEREVVFETEEGALRQVKIFVHEMTAQPVATIQMLEDAAIDLEQFIRTEVSESFARKENSQFVNGDGVKEPLGFAADTNVPTFESSASGDYVSDDIIDLFYDIKTEYSNNGKWFVNRKQIAKIRKFTDNEGQYLWQVSLIPGQPATLLGAPIVETTDLPTTNAAGQKPIFFGDMRRAYRVVDRLGITMIRDDITAKGAVKFWFRKRTGGTVQIPEALVALIIKA